MGTISRLSAGTFLASVMATTATEASERYVPPGAFRFDCSMETIVSIEGEEKNTVHRFSKSFTDEDFRAEHGNVFEVPQRSTPWHGGHKVQLNYYSTKLRNGGERKEIVLSLVVENDKRASAMSISKVPVSERRIEGSVSLHQWTKKNEAESRKALDPKFRMAKSYPPEPGLVGLTVTCVLADPPVETTKP